MITSHTQAWYQQLRRKRVAIWGLSREGWSTYSYLRKHFPRMELTLIDKLPWDQLSSSFQNILESDEDVKYLKQTSALRLYSFEVVFKSAGIRPYQQLVQEAWQKGVIFSSNIKLFFDVIKENKPSSTERLSYPLLIGVTGTKGKTTTASLIYHILSQTCQDVYFGGNVGQPILDQLSLAEEAGLKRSIFVLELSSNQLLDLHMSPNIAVVQALTPDHLDYYPTVESYYSAKSAIARFQTSQDWLLFASRSAPTQVLAGLSPAYKIEYDLNNQILELTTDSDWILFRGERVVKISEVPLKGRHNLLNVMPAVGVARLLDITKEQINQALSTFTPVEHRLELVGRTENGVEFVNDSAGTTPESAIAALEAYQGQSVILIAGQK